MHTESETRPLQVDIVRAAPPDRRIGRNESIPRWSAFSRLALGALTFSMPVVATALGIASLAAGVTVPPVVLATTVLFFVAHTLISMMYVGFAAQNPRLERGREVWMLALVLAGPITIPAYWLMHVWPAPKVGRRDVDEVDSSGVVHAHAVLSPPAGLAHAVA
jgi:hypothetical protein